jgi:hypothetical protein
MRILFTIPHFFNNQTTAKHGSQSGNSQNRLNALTNNIAAIHQLFSKAQGMIDIAQLQLIPSNQNFSYDLDIIICTIADYHLIDKLPFPSHWYQHYVSNIEPMMLGFECQSILRDNLGKYDYYCFLEDDLILRDPLFFLKLNWFNQQVGDQNLLQPNRYEAAIAPLVNKVYIDGNLRPDVAGRFQNIHDQPTLNGSFLGVNISFERPLNPHSGAYFLNQKQMEYWSQQTHFLDKNTDFVSPLESAATLGIMKTFKIYKPAPVNANFLEIQHFGVQFLSLVGNKVKRLGVGS